MRPRLPSMVARLDHLTVVAPALDVGVAHVLAALGMEPGPGREHPGMATHNRLLSLGPEAYLEVISARPGAPPIGRARWFDLDRLRPDSPARLAAWVASTDDIECAWAPELGAIETMHRETHTWRMTVRPDGSLPLDGAAPLLIQRAPGARPAAALPPSGLQLLRLRILHPRPAQVRALFDRIGLAPEPEVIVARGDACALAADVLTPSGVRTLGGLR